MENQRPPNRTPTGDNPQYYPRPTPDLVGRQEIPTPHPPAPASYDPSVINELLKKKRKARELKACYPCRQRKVKCNGELPCEGCLQRQHPELCVMLGPTSKKRCPAAPSSAQAATPAVPAAVHPRPAAADHIHVHAPAASSPDTNPGSLMHPPGAAAAGFDAMLSRLSAIEDAVSALKGDLLRLRDETFRGASAASPGSRASPALGHTPASEQSPRSVPLRRTEEPQTAPTPKEGIRARDETTGGTVYLGRNSVPAFMVSQKAAGSPGVVGSPGGRDKDLPLQVFALHNSTLTYPFTHLPFTPLGIEDVAKALPADDQQILRYFGSYKAVAHRIYPVISDMGQFEAHLMTALRERKQAAAGVPIPVTSRWKNPSWVSLLFAIMASGIQFSDDDRKERQLSSKVYVCCSFQCLRIANFFIQPTIEQIQSLLLLVNCIRNDTNPGAAWILLGTTIRLAQSIGLHQQLSDITPRIQERNRKVWWSVMWQDALLSFSYDRPNGATTWDCGVPVSSAPPGQFNFIDVMYTLLRIVIGFSTDPALHDAPAPSPANVQNYIDRLARLREEAMSEDSMCDTLERLTIRIHTGYLISQMYRFILRRPDNLDAAGHQEHQYTVACLDTSADVVHAFVDMHTLSPAVVRSWAFVHNALSCALLLGLLPDALKRQEVRGLLRRMIGCLESIMEDTSAKSYAKSLAVLKEMYEARVEEEGVHTPDTEALRNSYEGPRPEREVVATQGEREGWWENAEQERIMESIIWGDPWEGNMGVLDSGLGQYAVPGARPSVSGPVPSPGEYIR